MAPRRPRSTSNVSSNPTNIPRAPTSSPLLRKQIVVASDSIYNNNLTVLKRGDPTILSIIDQFSHVCLYNYNGRTQKWAKEGFEGSMFIVEHVDEPIYGIYILNRMGTGDYVRRIYPEDDMEVFGKYLMYRYYPDFTKKRIAMNLPYPVPDQYRQTFDAEFAKDNSEPDDPDPTKKRKMQGNSVTLGYWAFPQEAHEPLEDVMMRLREHIKAGKRYPDEFRYFPGRQQQLQQYQHTGNRHSQQNQSGVGIAQEMLDMAASKASEVDKLFAKLQPSQTLVSAAATGSQPSSSRSVESWFTALAGQEAASSQSTASLNVIPVPSLASFGSMGAAMGPVTSSRGLALLDTIFASVSQPSVGDSAHIVQPTQQHPPPRPEEIQIVSPKPQSSALPKILTQNTISSLLGLSPGSADSRSSSAALSSNSSQRSGAKRYEGDNELSENEAPSACGHSVHSTVLDTVTDPVPAISGPTYGNPLSYLEQGSDGLLSACTSIQGDVTPRAGLRGMGSSTPLLAPQAGQPYFTACPASADALATLTSRLPASASPAGAGSRGRSLIPFSSDHELWPYPRPPLNDNEHMSDRDVVELDFSDTRALSNPAIFQEKQAKQGKGDRKRKSKKDKATEREQERAAIENGWDDPTKGQVTLAASHTAPSVASSTEALAASSLPNGKVTANGDKHAKASAVAAGDTGGAAQSTADVVREALLASLAAHPKGPAHDLSRKQFLQEVLSLLYTDNSFVDKLYQEYSSLTHS